MENREDKQTVEVPKGSGRSGLLLAINEILKLPRVQNITIDSKGRVTYTRILLEKEAALPLTTDFETMTPAYIIRNTDLTEVLHSNEGLSDILLVLFDRITSSNLCPLGFVGSNQSLVWPWLYRHLFKESVATSEKTSLFGYPFYGDRNIDDDQLFLCAGYVRDASLSDTQKAFKILIPHKGTEDVG